MTELEAYPTHGLNVVGFFEAELGIGEIARRLVVAAEHAGIPTSTLTYRHTNSRQAHRFRPRPPETAPYDTNVICVNAEGLATLQRDLGPALFGGRYSIAVWFWELARFPSNLHRAFDLIDEVWTASEFTRDAIGAQTDKPVRVVPIPLDAPPLQPFSREELGLPDAFVFLFSFDFFSVFERKNPIGVVEAFRRAFAPSEGPVLVVKSINGERKPAELDRLQSAASNRPDILLLDGYVSSEEKDALTAACDSYVSLHRSEGLGLTMADAMAFAKPVIATGYSGNLAFMNESNSYLVRHHLSRTPEGCDPYPAGVEWADPELDHAAELMRRVYEDPEAARELGARARCDIADNHSVDRTAAFMRERLAKIPMHSGLLRHVRGPLEHAAAMTAQEPGASLVKESGPLGVLRRLLRRLLWPELDEQRRIDRALVESLRALERATREELDRIERSRPSRDPQDD